MDGRALDLAITAQRHALARARDARAAADLGLLELVKAERAGGDWLAAAIADHRRALALSPAQPYAWARLARAELLARGPDPVVGRLLVMSARTAPADRRLIFARLDLAFASWRRLDAADAAALGADIARAAALDLRRLVALARKRGALAPVRAALAPDLARAFDAVLLEP